jgi:hypothetical protein
MKNERGEPGPLVGPNARPTLRLSLMNDRVVDVVGIICSFVFVLAKIAQTHIYVRPKAALLAMRKLSTRGKSLTTNTVYRKADVSSW